MSVENKQEKDSTSVIIFVLLAAFTLLIVSTMLIKGTAV